MQRWEHLKLIVTVDEVWNTKNIPYKQEAVFYSIYYPNGDRSLKFQSEKEMREYVEKDIGNQGYELVSAQEFRNDEESRVTFRDVLWFKRLINGS